MTGPPAPASCPAQLASWAGSGEGAQLSSFGTDIGGFGDALTALDAGVQDGDATSAQELAVQSSAAAMQQDAKGLRASPGPSCVPGLADHLHAAALDISAAAAGSIRSVGEYSAGDTGAAASSMNAAAAAMDNGTSKITAANRALKSYETSIRTRAAKKAPRKTPKKAPSAAAATTRAAAPAPPAPAAPPSAAPAGCYPLTSGGSCYQPGEYCRDADHGMTGQTADGEPITCEDNDGWRWEAA